MSRPVVAASAALLALALGGCQSVRPATIAGECAVIRPVPYAVRADTRVGQRWVDSTIEAGVAVCGHPRPPAVPS
ncbi:hypothetical protein [Acuticoccus mangrovi]|uniref:Lipoprotein n=1 Tax=Acuticoccus mangrovi TaxID=2796142 RepID=A0A934MHS8_9HYPH|nr:hypothetical protein [Acuticoccus mangrovi]MBJ3776411.1 hypothetical protein [Acuticoccus mangrovi]